jgi:myotubularin-related protein 9
MDLSEYIKKSRVDNVLLKHGPRPKSYGTIALTSHHFIFQPAPSPNTPNNGRNDELWLLLRAVDIAVSDATIMNKGILTLKCKNFMICSFEMEKPQDALLLAQSINALSNLKSPGHEFPYFYRSTFTVLDDGWNIYDVSQQFCELSTLFPDIFRLTSVNKNFHVCSSYPDKSIVVKGVGDDYLRLCATFRRDGRFPVVSFVDYSTKSILVRTSEPLLGPTNRRCIEDEAVHKAYLLNKNMGILLDTRSKTALASAKARGGGYESAFYYRSWNIIFLELPRTQDIQASFHKVVETCNDYGNVNFHSRLNASNWLPTIALVLSKAGVIAQSMHYVNPGHTHIVHGGESKDMTLMMTSLCAIILDSNARTLRGFQSLIEREWILGGHPFGERCSHSAYATGGGEEAPVFVCFLNCVFQMMHAYPSAFEFTDHFLINIFEHSYASEFGTFLYDSERDRHHSQLRKRTVSLWSYVNHPEILSTFMNPLYVPIAQPLWPVISGVIHVLWQRLFLRWNLTWDEADESAAIAAESAEKVKKLQSQLRTLLNQQHSGGHSIPSEEITNLKIDG